MIRLPLLGLIVIALALVAPFSTATSTRELMVCVDPNNVPFPTQAAQDLKNKRVEPSSPGLQAKVEHVRWSPRHADLQRTSYVFVTRADQPLSGLTLDDRRPRSVMIGLRMAGSGAMSSPPVSATAAPPVGNVNALVTAGSLLLRNGGR